MKKTLKVLSAIVLTLALTLPLAACGEKVPAEPVVSEPVAADPTAIPTESLPAGTAPSLDLAEGTVFVSISIDGELVVAAQAVTPAEMTYESALIAAHDAFYEGGAEAGFLAEQDPTYGIYLITKSWGLTSGVENLPLTPYMLINDAIQGAVDAPVATGDNHNYLQRAA